MAVSYTHLDVYKRQIYIRVNVIVQSINMCACIHLSICVSGRGAAKNISFRGPHYQKRRETLLQYTLMSSMIRPQHTVCRFLSV